jgi:hypothetical protein
MEDRGFGSLVLYARDGSGSLALVTLSPNSSERAPELTAEQRSKPYAPAVLRCVRDAAPTATVPRSNPPPLPEAAACLKALRLEQASLHATPAAPPPELVQLEAWLKQASHSPNVLYTEPGQRELLQLLAAPTIETLAREAREEQSLTERYAELADALDAPDVSPSERQRRQAEFDTLRKRLSGQIARSAMASSAQRRQLSALLARLQSLLFDTEQAKKAAKKAKRAFVDPAPVQRRVQELQGAAAAAAPRPATSAKPAAR